LQNEVFDASQTFSPTPSRTPHLRFRQKLRRMTTRMPQMPRKARRAKRAPAPLPIHWDTPEYWQSFILRVLAEVKEARK